MYLYAALFYLFSFVMIAFAFNVIISKNPVVSVLSMIMCFFNGAGLFMLSYSEFLSLILIIIYVGAIAVLMLFVVMMLNIESTDAKLSSIKHALIKHKIAIFTIMSVMFIEMCLIVYTNYSDYRNVVASNPVNPEMSDVQNIGYLLYNVHPVILLMVALVLFIAMVGSIVITYRDKEPIYRQSMFKQSNMRGTDTSYRVKVNIESGSEVLGADSKK